MDHSIGTISPCTVAEIPRQAIEDVITHHPRVTKALMWCSLVDEAVLREWLVNNGTPFKPTGVSRTCSVNYCYAWRQLDASATTATRFRSPS